MTMVHGRRLCLSRRPQFLGALSALLFAACAVFAATARAAGSEDASLAVFRHGAVTRGEFAGYQKWKLGPDGYAQLLRDRNGLRTAVLRQATLEIVAELAVQGGFRKTAAFAEALRAYENKAYASLWREEVANGVVLRDEELDGMVPPQQQEVELTWASFGSQAEATAFAAALRAGAQFDAAAAKAGVPDPEKGQTRLGVGTESHFSEESRAKALALGPGEVAGPLREPIGWYVVQAAGRLADPEQYRRRQREELRPAVLKAKREKAVADAVAALRAKAAIQIDEKVLADWDARGGGRAVAQVNGETVVFKEETQHGFPKHATMDKLLRAQLDKQIEELLEAQEGRRLGLERKDAGWSDKLGYFSLDLLVDLYREEVFRGFAVDEGEVRKYYNDHLELFKGPAVVRLRQIVLQSRFLAERYRQDLLAGRATFEDLAKRESIDRTSAARGGDQGWLPVSALRPEFKSYVEALRQGEITVPINLGGNYFLIKLESRTEPEVIPYEQIRERASARALLAKRTDSYSAFIARKLTEEQVKLNDAEIKRLVVTTP